uniref:GEO09106p1 n=1 Tax=Drosophila melanogaster TaxID=7227 RepID=Q9VGQ7_DROME|eukprot:NP_001247040.1 uncharacterized protein Dmel_CG17721, isoform B [Drosophila melanogaster]
MVYVNLIIGLGLVSVAAFAYFNWHNDRSSPYSRSPNGRCTFCQYELSDDDRRRMRCGHAMHNLCYLVFRYSHRKCLECDKVVNVNIAGDLCTICLDPLSVYTMVYLRCSHALHEKCLHQYQANGGRHCPVCRMGIKE